MDGSQIPDRDCEWRRVVLRREKAFTTPSWRAIVIHHEDRDGTHASVLMPPEGPVTQRLAEGPPIS